MHCLLKPTGAEWFSVSSLPNRLSRHPEKLDTNNNIIKNTNLIFVVTTLVVLLS